MAEKCKVHNIEMAVAMSDNEMVHCFGKGNFSYCPRQDCDEIFLPEEIRRGSRPHRALFVTMARQKAGLMKRLRGMDDGR